MSDERHFRPTIPSKVPVPGEVIDRTTRRWYGLSALVTVALGVGVVVGRPALVLAGVVGAAFLAYSKAGTASPPTVSLAVERTVDVREPDPGDEVRVEVRVENAGEATLPDLRLVDGVPDALTVTDGPARHATALRPGEHDQFAYTVEASRGAHTWEPALALARDWSGSVERALRVGDAAPAVTCAPSLELGRSFPRRSQTTGLVGDVAVDRGGSGTEFHAVREYRRGDPLNRLDWNRVARTGELATREFRVERAATVVLLVDARKAAYAAPSAAGPSAVDRSVEAAGEVFTALEGAGDRVGVAALAPRTCWLAPGAGETHRANARELLGTHPALSPTAPEQPFYPSVQFRRLRRRLPSDAQVVFFSPLVDDHAARVARRLEGYGHAVTVVSPDPTASDSTGRRFAGVERTVRLSDLRRAGLRVVDWPADTALEAAVGNARRGWSR